MLNPAGNLLQRSFCLISSLVSADPEICKDTGLDVRKAWENSPICSILEAGKICFPVKEEHFFMAAEHWLAIRMAVLLVKCKLLKYFILGLITQCVVAPEILCN